MSQQARRIDVLGVGISPTTPAATVAEVGRWIAADRRDYVCLTPVSGVMAAQRDPAVLRAIDGAGITAPDGMPLVWSGRIAGARPITRVYGPDLMAALCAESVARGWRNYFYGGGPGVAERAASNLQAELPGLRVAGVEAPPYRPPTQDEAAQTADRINRSGAELVWVGLSTPKQDLLMARMVELLEPPAVMLGVGAAFDIHAGLQKHPPGFLGPLGLFWLYRLAREPRRLAGRYLRDIPAFLYAVSRHRPFLRRS